MKNIYLLKDLAIISGFSTHTLKYYLTLGLIEEIGRSPTTNFRYFDDSTLQKLNQIKNLRSQKYSIKDIQNQLNSLEGNVLNS